MRKFFFFTLLLMFSIQLGCGGSTPVETSTSNPVETTDKQQKDEDEKRDGHIDNKSRDAK